MDKSSAVRPAVVDNPVDRALRRPVAWKAARRGRAMLTAAITSTPTRRVGSFGLLIPLAGSAGRVAGRRPLSSRRASHGPRPGRPRAARDRLDPAPLHRRQRPGRADPRGDAGGPRGPRRRDRPGRPGPLRGGLRPHRRGGRVRGRAPSAPRLPPDPARVPDGQGLDRDRGQPPGRRVRDRGRPRPDRDRRRRAGRRPRRRLPRVGGHGRGRAGPRARRPPTRHAGPAADRAAEQHRPRRRVRHARPGRRRRGDPPSRPAADR